MLERQYQCHRGVVLGRLKPTDWSYQLMEAKSSGLGLEKSGALWMDCIPGGEEGWRTKNLEWIVA